MKFPQIVRAEHAEGWYRIWLTCAVIAWIAGGAIIAFSVISLRPEITRIDGYSLNDLKQEARYWENRYRCISASYSPVSVEDNSTQPWYQEQRWAYDNGKTWGDIKRRGRFTSTRGDEWIALNLTLNRTDSSGLVDDPCSKETTYSFEQECLSSQSILGLVLLCGSILLSPFIVLMGIFLTTRLLLALIFWQSRLFVWIRNGFGQVVESPSTWTKGPPHAVEIFFWRRIKPWLWLPGAVLVALFVVFSFATGIGLQTTLKALGTAGGTVLLMVLGWPFYALYRALKRRRMR